MEQFVHLLCDMSPYLLLGFLLAGLMHAFVPGKLYGRYLASRNIKSVVNAALLGIPLPLCSCGVIPTAMSLRREGASHGAVVSFLIATPQTGIDSIVATYGLMGLPFAIIRPVAALLVALLGGTVAQVAGGEDYCQQTSEAQVQSPSGGFASRLREALRYGLVDMMHDIGRWLLLGLVAAAVVTILVPTEWFVAIEDNTWASMLLVLLIAIPMYVCATGSIPVAVALMMKGLTPGAALVLLMAGPACNLASILVVRKVLGLKTMCIYLASIVVGAVTMGLVVDYLQYHHIVDFLGHLVLRGSCCSGGHLSWFSVLSAVTLLGLLANAWWVSHTRSKNTSTTSKSSNMKVYHIEGMSCNHCRMSAEKAILAVEGVTAATVNLQEKAAYVEGTAQPEEVCKAVDSLGFKCTC